MWNVVRHIFVQEARIGELERRANDHERRIMFLEIYKEVHANALRKIHELQAIQWNQGIRLGNLALSVESELIPRLEQLEQTAQDDGDRAAVMNLGKQLKNNLTRARKRISA